ncbi:hypothetical protein [Bosea sp. Leaf344]|uniref:hypothetical protein n=1 Tax=Bosea sp. Leaf344 TaxID=1736346 RepID=UPI000AF912F4|nr:hypothetical protein [Bosea sp. Leaf344]
MIDSDVLLLLRTTIRSVWTLELALLLWRSGERAWRQRELVSELRASEGAINEGLDRLLVEGLIRREADAYRFDPSPRNQALFERLDLLNRERPVAVLEVMFRRQDAVQSFADAFKLKKD